MKRKIKRFESGGYTGDDPIVKYRMGQLSEADTYDALGQKDLADASRAKEVPRYSYTVEGNKSEPPITSDIKALEQDESVVQKRNYPMFEGLS